MTKLDKTSITELAEFFPASGGSIRFSRSNLPAKITGVATRYWLPGDTYEQALARQQEARDKLEAQIKARNL